MSNVQLQEATLQATAEKTPVCLFVRRRQASARLEQKLYSWESEWAQEDLDLRHWNYALGAYRPGRKRSFSRSRSKLQ